MKLGFQMSSVTPYLQSVEQLQAACEKVAQMGYEDVQLQGVSTDIPDGEIARALQQAGLRCVATQEDYPAGFGANPERFIARAQACGISPARCFPGRWIPRRSCSGLGRPSRKLGRR